MSSTWIRRGSSTLMLAIFAGSSTEAGAGGLALQPDAASTTNAIYTTTNPALDGAGHCLNGNEAVNCYNPSGGRLR